MSKTYLGFNIDWHMFLRNCQIDKKQLSVKDLKDWVRLGVIVFAEQSYKKLLKVIVERFNLGLEIPARYPAVSLASVDRVLVIGVSRLPRLKSGRYTRKEAGKATFTFNLFTVS
ncbi:MAG TPA: hypothetical protein VJA27_04275 [Patescibacteria group bacterium]|nr:hypothetical protein [Patescibacteria group bacterium]